MTWQLFFWLVAFLHVVAMVGMALYAVRERFGERGAMYCGSGNSPREERKIGRAHV